MKARRHDHYSLVLQTMNALRLPFLRACARVRRVYEAWKRRHYPLIEVFEDDPRGRILAFMIWIPTARFPRPVVYILYVSAQQWYITPSKVEPKVRKILKKRSKYVGSMQADVYQAIVCMRATSGAVRIAVRYGIPIRRPEEVRKDMINYFKKRWLGILEAIRGKRIFGELVFFVYLLQEILRELGVLGDLDTLLDSETAYRIAEEGYVVVKGLGPPSSQALS